MESTANKPESWPWPESLDAVVAAPGSHRVVLENETTRVLEVTIAPGEREPEHTHRWPSVMVVQASKARRGASARSAALMVQKPPRCSGSRRTGRRR